MSWSLNFQFTHSLRACQLQNWISISHGMALGRLGLVHIFIQLGPTPPTPPSLPGLPHAPCQLLWHGMLYQDICNFDVILLSHWFSTKKSSHASAGREHGEDQALREAWKGRGPAE